MVGYLKIALIGAVSALGLIYGIGNLTILDAVFAEVYSVVSFADIGLPEAQ